MTDNKDLVFKLQFPGPDGKPVPVQFSVDGLRGLIVQLLQTVASVPQPPTLEFVSNADRQPIRATGLGISPLEGDENFARVSIVVGPIDLQFAMPLAGLVDALQMLQDATEPDPKSSHRPN